MIGRRSAVMVLATCLLAPYLAAQTVDKTPSETADRKADLDTFAKDAQTYDITVQTEPRALLQLSPQPVMNWNGSAFVWLDRGRPEVIGTFWKSGDNRTGQARWQHAFHSLSEQPISAHFNGQLVWSSKSPGIQFYKVDEAEEPADKPWRRLAQMRELAREFSVRGVYPRYENYHRTLRLLTQPIFRYDSPPTVIDGGTVYSADVVGIDPDAFLLLEARQREGKLRWEFAFARFHYIELTGHYRNQEVWRVENEQLASRQHRFGSDPGRDSVYYSVAKP